LHFIDNKEALLLSKCCSHRYIIVLGAYSQQFL
jgi:hypothetical protein